MAYRRTKNPTIYAAVNDFWNNAGGVNYIAHAVLSNGTVVNLGPETQGTGGTAINHPDQIYWRDNARRFAGIIGGFGAATVARIEIDCSLMPCDGLGGCTTSVPLLMTAAGFANTPIHVFSHRDENMGRHAATPSSKRVIVSNTSDGADRQRAAYNAHDGWGWVS